MDAHAPLKFDGWTLLRPSGELLRDGRRVRLQEQPLQILVALLERPGELVTREQLFARLWPAQVVEYETSLNAAVRRLRAVLDDDADAPRYIETIPRRGYRFIGRLEPDGGGVPSASGTMRHPGRWIASGIATALLAGLALWSTTQTASHGPADQGQPASIVVLPFVDLSEAQDSRYFADGLTEELMQLLARDGKLRVVARTSAFAFRGQPIDVAEIARQLGVSHVLEGSVRRSGEQLRVTAQLIDGGTRMQVWSHTYDRKIGDVSSIQDDIAASAASVLGASLAGVPPAMAAADPEAYDRALLARFLTHRRADGDLQQARRLYEEAVSIDPDFARAWAGLSSVYWLLVADGALDMRTGLELVGEAARRALALDPGLAEAHVRLAIRAWALGDVALARRHRELAARYEPGHPLVLVSQLDTAMAAGRLDEAIEVLERIVRMDPLSVVNRHNYAFLLLIAGRPSDAIVQMRRILELEPDHSVRLLCSALAVDRRHAEIRNEARSQPPGPDRHQCEALALGDAGAAEAAYRALEQSAGRADPFRVAETAAYRGDTERAFAWLESAQEACADRVLHPLGCSLRELSRSPLLASLHGDPRWAEWQARLER